MQANTHNKNPKNHNKSESGEDESFKSFDQEQSNQDVPIASEIPKRPTYSQELKLVQIYKANQSRRRILLDQIKQLEEQRRLKHKAQQLQRDKLYHAVIVGQDSDSEIQQEMSRIADIRKDYALKKSRLDKLESHYHQFRKSMAGMVVELQLNNTPHLRDKIQELCEVTDYEYISKRSKLAVLYSLNQGEATESKILFRSIGIPDKMLKAVDVKGLGSKLSHCQDLLLVVVNSLEFHIYDMSVQRFMVKSPSHQYAIVYAKLFTRQLSNIFVLTVTEKGVVRIFDLQKRQMAFLALCTDPETEEVGTQYTLSPNGSTLYFSLTNRVYSLNLVNKRITKELMLPIPVIELAPTYIRTAQGFYNNYQSMFRSKGSHIVEAYVSIDVSQAIVVKWYCESHMLIINNIEHALREGQFHVCTHRRTSPHSQKEQAILVFGNKKGQLNQWNIQL